MLYAGSAGVLPELFRSSADEASVRLDCWCEHPLPDGPSLGNPRFLDGVRRRFGSRSTPESAGTHVRGHIWPDWRVVAPRRALDHPCCLARPAVRNRRAHREPWVGIEERAANDPALLARNPFDAEAEARGGTEVRFARKDAVYDSRSRALSLANRAPVRGRYSRPSRLLRTKSGPAFGTRRSCCTQTPNGTSSSPAQTAAALSATELGNLASSESSRGSPGVRRLTFRPQSPRRPPRPSPSAPQRTRWPSPRW